MVTTFTASIDCRRVDRKSTAGYNSSQANLDSYIMRRNIHKRPPDSHKEKGAESVKRPKKPNGTGSIRQRPNGKWEGRVMINGKSRTVSGSSAEDVQVKLDVILNPFDFMERIDPETITVEQWVALWIETYGKDVKQSTLKRYKVDTRLRIIPLLGKMRVMDVKPLDIKRVYNLAKEQGLKQKSIKNLHGTLHTILQAAIENDIIDRNPASKVKVPKSEEPPKEMIPLQDDEVITFLEKIKNHRLWGLFFVALFTGMREAELIGLTWDCVDFEHKQIKVYRQFSREASRDNKVAFSSLKNGKTRIIVPPDDVFKTFRKVKAQQSEQQLKAGQEWSNDNDFVFTNKTGKHLCYQTIYRQFKAIVEDMGLPEVRFHDLRHTYATISLQSGVDPKTVSSNMGHATVAFTLDKYGHVSNKMRKNGAEKLQQYIANM